jgi:hypothetical protein
VNTCNTHPDRTAAHLYERDPAPLPEGEGYDVRESGSVLLCDECAEVEKPRREVRQIKGWLWGLPVVGQEEPLDAEFIG